MFIKQNSWFFNQAIALWKKKFGGMRNFTLKELCHEIQAN